MSVKVSSWVWHGQECADLVGNELVLMLALSDIAGDEGRCRFMDDEAALTYAALAKKVRVDRRTIERLIPKLRERGLLMQSKGAKGRPNEFTLLVPWAKTSTDTMSVNDDSLESDSPTAVQHSPTPASTFTDTSGIDTSLIRINVLNVKESDASDVDGFSEEVHRLCNLLVDLVRANGHKAKVGKSWLRECDRLIRLDEYTPEQVEWVMRWACERSPFWSTNIRSMPTLREKFSTLKGQALTAHAQVKKLSTVEHGRSVDDILAARESELLAVGR